MTAFAILSYGKRDFATGFRSKAIKTEKYKRHHNKDFNDTQKTNNHLKD